MRLIEVFKNDLYNFAYIVDEIRGLPQKFIIYCDVFSFEGNENTSVVLKTELEGSIELSPKNVILYVTSNRRHFMPEYMEVNLNTKIVNGELHYADAVEEKIALADRFGLCLSLYQRNIEEYLRIVDRYFPDVKGGGEELHAAAKSFSVARASKSGRTAKQFYNYYSAQEV